MLRDHYNYSVPERLQRETKAWQQHENSLANRLNRLRVIRILKLAESCIHGEDYKVLDVGCAGAGLSRLLSERCDVVGVDIQKSYMDKRRRGRGKLNFLLGDINALPFREECFDLLICTSVLEHLLDLDHVLPNLKRLLKKNGNLIVGYPIETWLFKLIWRVISPHEYAYIDPHAGQIENYWNNPTTHKQNYLAIRNVLAKHFDLVFQAKLPFSSLPDLFSFYECIKLKPRAHELKTANEEGKPANL
jgi:ubiquinone/menaquinone biosynthesis C-methylase UbiE